jgi:cytochrome c-type biogenesis protein CcsB
VNRLWVDAALLSYLAGTAVYCIDLVIQKRKFHTLGFMLLNIGFFFHTIHLVMSYINLGYFPVINFRQSLSMFSWAIAGSYILIQTKFNLRILGAFVAPLCAVLMIWSSALSETVTHVAPMYRSIWLAIHVTTVFAGNGLFAVGFVVAVMYLFQERHIKVKHFGFFFKRLPSLSLLDSLQYYCVMVGFPMLTLGIITGAIYAQLALGSYWRWDPKEVWSLITWILYAILVHQRLAVGWRGRRAALVSIVGFAVLIFSFSGVNFILKGYHNFRLLGGAP